jgi:hypothetical protein
MSRLSSARSADCDQADWRSSLFAGFRGALASQLWFVAFALIEARWRKVSLMMFPEPANLREGLGMTLIVIAAGILVWTAR